MGRNTGYLGARTVAHDESKVLALMPLFPGESVDRLMLDCIATGLSDTDVSNPIELNWMGLAIPWNTLDLLDPLADGTQPDFSTVAQYDSAFDQMLRNADETDVELFGGDVDADPEDTTRDVDLKDSTEELIDELPIGPYIFLRHEVLGRPYAAAGNDTIRHGDDFKMMIPGSKFHRIPHGQLLMFGMVRYAGTTTETNFNLELDDATAIQTLALLKSGQLSRIQQKIATDTGATGDWLRTVLFGGDNFTEASTFVGTSVKAYMKARLHISGPLSRSMR